MLGIQLNYSDGNVCLKELIPFHALTPQRAVHSKWCHRKFLSLVEDVETIQDKI